jgi:hypothetical protein
MVHDDFFRGPDRKRARWRAVYHFLSWFCWRGVGHAVGKSARPGSRPLQRRSGQVARPE